MFSLKVIIVFNNIEPRRFCNVKNTELSGWNHTGLIWLRYQQKKSILVSL